MTIKLLIKNIYKHQSQMIYSQHTQFHWNEYSDATVRPKSLIAHVTYIGKGGIANIFFISKNETKCRPLLNIK